MARLDLTGQVFGRLTVLERRPASTWRCRCECGKETLVQTGSLRNGRTRSCGCGRRIDLTDQVFDRLTVIESAPNNGTRTMWRCRCICGRETVVDTACLRAGVTRSCGCLRDDINSVLHRTHGDSKSREHQVWAGMIDRCRNPNSTIYTYYGGRGIHVYDRWLSYENFLFDMGRRPPGTTIERKDPNGPYSPDNCYWASRREQARNRRSSVYVDFRGQKKLLCELAEEYGFNYYSLYHRIITNGWSIEKAISTPINYRLSKELR